MSKIITLYTNDDNQVGVITGDGITPTLAVAMTKAALEHLEAVATAAEVERRVKEALDKPVEE